MRLTAFHVTPLPSPLVRLLTVILGVSSLVAPVVASLALSPAAHAAPLKETWYVEGALSRDLFQSWSRATGAPGLRWNLKDAYPSEIEQIPAFPAQRKVQVILGDFPNESLIPALSRLAQAGAEAVLLTGTFPGTAEIARLNRIAFKKLLLVAGHYPDPELGQALQSLAAPLEIVFAVRAYPRFVDRPNLLSIPSQIPLTFSTDYWPWYSHMDLFNLLPNPLRLRVKDSFPVEESLPYLNNIHRLESLSVDLQSPAQLSAWNVFREKSVRWLSTGRVPDSAELQDFVASALRPELRSLTIDSDLELMPEERKRLESLSIPVEWTHAPLPVTQSRTHP